MAEASHPQNLMIYYIPWIILIVTIVIQIFHYSFFGPKIKNEEGTEKLLWWSIKERIIHLILMLTFLTIVITGLILTVSPEKAQSGIMSFIRNSHNIGPIYGIASLLMLIIWIRCALFKKYDFTWLRHIGGYLGYKGELKSGKFNAGQKLWFWMVIIWSSSCDFRGKNKNFGNRSRQRRVAVLIHLISASIMLAMLLVHMYMLFLL